MDAVAVRIEPAGPERAAAIQDVARAAFTDPAAAAAAAPPADPDSTAFYTARDRYLAGTDPGSVLCAVDAEDRVVGAVVAYVRGQGRDAVWALPLLVVRPDAQSGGLGGRLLAAALATAPDGCRRVFTSSPDPRAMRAYVRSGHRLLPALRATGVADRAALRRAVPAAGAAREVDLDQDLDRDLDRLGLTDLAGDLRVLLDLGGRVLVTEGAAAIVYRGTTRWIGRILVADSAEMAAAALAAALLSGDDVGLDGWTASATYATEVALAARMDLATTGPVVVANQTEALTALCPPPAVFY